MLPNSQKLNINTKESTTVMFSVLVQHSVPVFDTLQLVDSTGTLLNANLVSQKPSGNYESNSVLTFSLTLPIGQRTTQTIQAYLYSNNIALGCNSSNDCSNIADISFVQSGAGILNIAPKYIKLTTTYSAQVYTVTNTGESKISNILNIS